MLAASFGVNKILVTYPDVVKAQFPHHVTNTTLYGRLANKDALINVDFELDHNDQVWRAQGPPRLPQYWTGLCAANCLACGAFLASQTIRQLGGYVGTFDIRDPGSYTLQIIVGAYFGNTEPPHTPLPIVVGTHAIEYNECNVVRSLVNGGTALGVELAKEGTYLCCPGVVTAAEMNTRSNCSYSRFRTPISIFFHTLTRESNTATLVFVIVF